jgi:hypothetical protein
MCVCVTTSYSLRSILILSSHLCLHFKNLSSHHVLWLTFCNNMLIFPCRAHLILNIVRNVYDTLDTFLIYFLLGIACFSACPTTPSELVVCKVSEDTRLRLAVFCEWNTSESKQAAIDQRPQ